ncbi:two-component system sensor histidine kinase NtrB [Magnetococcales bacterium HHB-1]
MSSPFEFQNLMEQLSIGIIAVDKNQIVRAVNTTAERLLGKPRHTLLDTPLDKTLPGHSVALDLINRSMKLAMPCRFRNTKLHSGPHQQTPVSITAVPLMDSEWQILGAALQLEETGAAERLEEGEWLNEAVDSMGSMAMAVAHEVKNPLTGIRAAAQLLEMDNNRETLTECTQLIRTEVDRISRLLDRLLGLADEQAIQKREVNIHEILNHCTQLQEQEIKIKKDYDPSLPPVLADKDQLIQVFINLIKNSCEASGKRGEISIRTRISNRIRFLQGKRNQHVVIEIHDNGPGIPPELHKRIFLPFVTTKSQSNGLGLPICQKIIHDHNGIIEVKSQPGSTLFQVLLPLPTPILDKTH